MSETVRVPRHIADAAAEMRQRAMEMAAALLPIDHGIYRRADVEALVEFVEATREREWNQTPPMTTKRLHDINLALTPELIIRVKGSGDGR